MITIIWIALATAVLGSIELLVRATTHAAPVEVREPDVRRQHR
jgi:hypothetical protein